MPDLGPLAGGDHVYILAWDGGPKKIGCSADPAKRLAGLQTGIPHAIRLLRTWYRPKADSYFVEAKAHGAVSEAYRPMVPELDGQLDRAVAHSHGER